MRSYHTKYILALWLMNPMTLTFSFAGSELSMRAAHRSTSYRRRAYIIVLIGSRVRLWRIRSPERICTRNKLVRILRERIPKVILTLSYSSHVRLKEDLPFELVDFDVVLVNDLNGLVNNCITYLQFVIYILISWLTYWDPVMNGQGVMDRLTSSVQCPCF